MEVNRLRYLCLEIYESRSNINPSFMKEIFQLRETNRIAWTRYKLNLSIPKVNQVSYGKNSLKYYGLKIWNFFRFMLRLVKILKLLKTSKIGRVLHVIVGCQSWPGFV